MRPDEVRAARNIMGMTVEKMAEALGVADRTLWRWQANGTSKRNGQQIAQLLKERTGL